MQIVTITGYKGIELGVFSKKDPAIPFIKKALKKQILYYIELGVEWFLISGQLGVEIWAGQVILELKDEYPTIKLGVFPPFLEQECNWNDGNKEEYYGVVGYADYVNNITNRKYEGPWQFALKNEFLIKKCDELLILYDNNHQGSPKFMVQMAEKMKKSITFITMDDLQEIVNEASWEIEGNDF